MVWEGKTLTMKHLVCFVEEESMKIVIEILTERLYVEARKNYVPPVFRNFVGKQKFKKSLLPALKAYLRPHAFFLVVFDRDGKTDCLKLKDEWQALVNQTDKSAVTCLRLICPELETFYLGDLKAVEQGLEIADLAKHQNAHPFRDPDQLPDNAKQEFLNLVKQPKQSIPHARAIAPHLALDDATNTSTSFHALIRAIRRFIDSVD
jgi:hypothetical protein